MNYIRNMGVEEKIMRIEQDVEQRIASFLSRKAEKFPEIFGEQGLDPAERGQRTYSH